jgi:hypothetical protein
MLNHVTYLMLANAADGQVVRKVVDVKNLTSLVSCPGRGAPLTMSQIKNSL